jgi:hypothetical protein
MFIIYDIYIFIILVGLFIIINLDRIYFLKVLNIKILTVLINLIELFFPFYYYHNYGYKRFILEDCDEPHKNGWTWFRFTERISRRLVPRKPKDYYRKVIFFSAAIASYLYICLVFII